MSESELIKRIAELEARNLELSEENDRLREKLGLPLQEPSPKEAVQIQQCIPEHTNIETSSQSTINKYSTPDEKIELFQSLFRGRPRITNQPTNQSTNQTKPSQTYPNLT